MAELDLEDKDIREMVRRNHQPEERWTDRYPYRPELERVACMKCGHDWPCAPVRALRRREGV